MASANAAAPDTATLPLRPKPAAADAVAVGIHRLQTNDGVVIKVEPPREPPLPAGLEALADAGADAGAKPPPTHVPCDIVLVIDVSGSMGTDAPVPTVEGQPRERNGLSVLDLVRHAARTILQTLDESDRLGIVTFATGVAELQPLTPMTAANKALTDKNIDGMVPEDTTNLWHGILKGISLFDGQTPSDRGRRVPAIMLLTDGMPNFMSPAVGFIPKMRTLDPIPAPIHTFGFGYSLRSGLLKSISEFTGGNYAFIPDAGMIGTVFVHAVANLQSTFATNVALRLTYPPSLQLDQTLGPEVGVQAPVTVGAAQALTVALGSMQYGQSRDLYLRYKISDLAGSDDVPLAVEVTYDRTGAGTVRAAASTNLGWRAVAAETTSAPTSVAPMPPSEIAFHVSRAMLCEFIAGLFPLDKEEEHKAIAFPTMGAAKLVKVIKSLPASAPQYAEDPACAALMADANGQVTMALSTAEYFHRWGQHFLPSLQGAHTAQQCNSFKDPGPLLYGADSPQFIAFRKLLDRAFDTIPPPRPSITPGPQWKRVYGRSAVGGAPPPPPLPGLISMQSYHNARGPCFASFCRVTLADGQTIRVNRLRRGMRVQTPRGPRTVVVVMKTPVRAVPMVTIGRLLITPWHPVSHSGGSGSWVFPCRDPAARKGPQVRYTGSIYSVLLQPDADADAHAVRIEGVWVVTLGHGMTSAADARTAGDVRVHKFFGNYAAVCRSLATLDVRKDGLVVNGGASRSNFRLWHSRK